MIRHLRRADALGAIAGAAGCLLLFLSVAVVDPQRGVSDEVLLNWWSDDSNRDSLVASSYLLLAACPFFLYFISRLRCRLNAAASDGWTDMVFGAGITFVVALGAVGVTRAVIAGSMRFDDEPLPGVDTLRFQSSLTYANWHLVMFFAAILIACVSARVLQSDALPKLIGWIGVPVAVGILVMVAIQEGPFALPLLIAWVLACSVVL